MFDFSVCVFSVTSENGNKKYSILGVFQFVLMSWKSCPNDLFQSSGQFFYAKGWLFLKGPPAFLYKYCIYAFFIRFLDICLFVIFSGIPFFNGRIHTCFSFWELYVYGIWIRFSSVIACIGRHGLPTASIRGGMDLVTTLPAPMTVPSPISTPGRITTLAAIQAWFPIFMGRAAISPSRRWSSCKAWVMVIREQLGPIMTWSPIVTSASFRMLRLKFPTKWSPIRILNLKSHRKGLWITLSLPNFLSRFWKPPDAPLCGMGASCWCRNRHRHSESACRWPPVSRLPRHWPIVWCAAYPVSRWWTNGEGQFLYLWLVSYSWIYTNSLNFIRWINFSRNLYLLKKCCY